IELVPIFAPPRAFFGTILPSGDYDLSLFTYVNTPDPGEAVEIWRCGGSSNFSGYCNRQVSRDLLESNLILDEKIRSALLDRVDAQMAKNLPAIPLYQKPTTVLVRNRVHGVVDNPTEEGWTWNAADWWVER